MSHVQGRHPYDCHVAINLVRVRPPAAQASPEGHVRDTTRYVQCRYPRPSGFDELSVHCVGMLLAGPATTSFHALDGLVRIKAFYEEVHKASHRHRKLLST